MFNSNLIKLFKEKEEKQATFKTLLEALNNSELIEMKTELENKFS